MVLPFKPGEFVGIPCKVQPGPFADERLIAVETDEGAISGFAQIENLKMSGDENGFVKAQITDVSEMSVTVRIFASFFTTASGQASLPFGWAQKNLQKMVA